ncbi:hypothetical protein FG379_000198 [Cryptosporidium bovis]|uniref:uncharacterized protein n=1 Tax=Cryptosporidium bovis TaxID=310047 RepID=UPI00351A8E8F|nr:hypothetical protein FG379_000198 [Cryptosporidium bovis]
MILVDAINVCQEFLKGLNSVDLTLSIPDEYFKFFEKFRDINQIFESYSTRDNFQLEAFESWNSILHCFNIILEKLIGIDIILDGLSEENIPIEINTGSQNNSENQKRNLGIENLHRTYEIVKELSLMFEKMRNFLEKNRGFISRSSTSGLSIVLILVKYLTFKKKSSNFDLIEKVQWISLYCLSLLFRIYKLEFTESWDIILFPEGINGLNSDQVVQVERYLTPNFFGRKDVPFLIYFLFSNSSKIRINTIVCIQSIFSAPILRFKNMIHFLSSKIPDYSQDKSAFSLLNNIINLTSSLIVFGNMFFSSNKSDIETKITLIKAFSQIVSSTPPLFWTNHFIYENTFLKSLSSLINFGIGDPNLIIPSLQLFSNVIGLNKNCEIYEELTVNNFHLSFVRILELNISIIEMDTVSCSTIKSNERPYNKVTNIVTESMNFFLKLIIHAPFFVFRSTFDEDHFREKNQLILLVKIVKYYTTNINKTDRIVFIKATKVAYNLLDKYRHLLQRNEELSNFQIYDTILNPCTDLLKINNCILISYDKELHSMIFDLVNSFINHIFIDNIYILSLYNLNCYNDIKNIDILCEIFNICSLLNPILIENAYCKNNLNNGKTFLNLIFYLMEKELNDKLLPFIIKNSLCFCSNSGSLIKPFETFQSFELSLVRRLLSFIENTNIDGLKESTLVSINKAIIFISDYHEMKEDGVIVCSLHSSKQNLNLLDFQEPANKDKIEISCILNWKDFIYKYKSFLVESNKDSDNLNNHLLNISEIIRALGHFSRLAYFSLDDCELLLWLLELIYCHIFQVNFNSFRLNKVKWNSIYAIGLLFQNYSFNKTIIKSFFSDNIKSKKLLDIFERVWNKLCSIATNNSELTKVRINALRSITVYNWSTNDNSLFKIPHFILLITWEAYSYAKRNESISQIQFKDLGNNSVYNKRYNTYWKSYLVRLSSTLYKDTLYHLQNSSMLLSSEEIERLEVYLTEFDETNTQ